MVQEGVYFSENTIEWSFVGRQVGNTAASKWMKVYVWGRYEADFRTDVTFFLRESGDP